MREPIKIFKTQEQLDACLREWQDRLFLSDWIIRARVVPQSEMNGEGNAGFNDWNSGIRTADIKIAEWGKIHDECLMKCPMESTLVHELLHCKEDPVTIEDPDYAGAFLQGSKHNELEELAKSLIMAKYNLTIDWFKNF